MHFPIGKHIVISMAISLFIGNLNFAATNEQLLSLLSVYGKIIQCTIVTDKFTLKSKGFARVDVENKETAEKIIRELNAGMFEGRPLKIEYFKKD